MLICAADNTPYSRGAFLFDVCFPPTYPQTPPLVGPFLFALPCAPTNFWIFCCGAGQFADDGRRLRAFQSKSLSLFATHAPSHTVFLTAVPKQAAKYVCHSLERGGAGGYSGLDPFVPPCLPDQFCPACVVVFRKIGIQRLQRFCRLETSLPFLFLASLPCVTSSPRCSCLHRWPCPFKASSLCPNRSSMNPVMSAKWAPPQAAPTAMTTTGKAVFFSCFYAESAGGCVANRNIQQATIRFAMIDMMKNPPPGFEKV